MNSCGSQVLFVGQQGSALFINTSIIARSAFTSSIHSTLSKVLENVEYQRQSCALFQIIDSSANSTLELDSFSINGLDYLDSSGSGLLLNLNQEHQTITSYFDLSFINFSLIGSTFEASTNSPVLKLDQSYKSFSCSHCSFNYILLNSSSLISFQAAIPTVSIYNLTISNNQLDGDSSALHFLSPSSSIYQFDHLKFQSSNMLSAASTLIKVPASGLSLNIANFTINGITNLQPLSLSIINLEGSSNTLIFEKIAFNVGSSLTSFLHVTGSLNSVTITSSHFQGLGFIPSFNSISSLIQVSTANNNLQVHFTTFLNLQYFINEGAIYHLNGAMLQQSYNFYTNISSLRAGGVYYISGASQLEITQNMYTGCASTYGAIFYLISTSTLQGHSITALFCMAYNAGGVLYSAQSSQYQIEHSLFQSNRAIVEGSVIYTSTQELDLSLSNSITETDFIENSSLQHLMSLHYTRLVVENCTMLRNYPSMGNSAGIELSTSTAYLRNTVMSNEGVEAIIGYQYTALGLLSIQRLGGLVATNSTFSHSRSEIGAVLFCLGYSSIQFINCTFTQIDSIVMGGVFFSNYVSLILMQDCSITYSTAVAGALFFNQFSNNITIANTLFQHNFSPSLFDLTFSNATFYNSTFNLNNSPTGPLISCIRCVMFQVYHSTFSSLLVSSTVKLQDVYVDQNYPFTMSDNYFYNITSMTSGGAISIDSIPHLTLSNNVFNLTLVTSGKGGAIMSSGDGMDISLSFNTFFLCMATEGGALMWEGSEPAGVLSNFYILNSATEYGNNYATRPNRLTFVNQSIAEIFGVTSTADTSNLLSIDPKSVTIDEDTTQVQVQSFRSSATMSPLFIAVLDQYNQVVRTVSGNLYFFLTSSVATDLTDFRADSNYEAQSGIFTLQNVRLYNQPESFLTLNFEAILSSPSMVFTPTLNVIVEIRNCETGEALGPDGSCTECERGKYLLELSDEPQVCLDCIPNAECFGGAMLAPAPGYWRPSNTSLLIYECYVKSACLGSPDPSVDGIAAYSAIGVCHSNYEGRLCAQCKDGFTRNSHFQCSQCPQPWKNYLILTTIVVVIVVLFIFLVRATLASSNKEKSVFTVFFKILVNHIQLMALLASFQYDWPEQIGSFFDLVKPVADVSSQIFSLDCFISYAGFHLFSGFYLRVLLFQFLPLLLIALSLIVWSIRYPCSKFPQLARSRTTATAFLLLFFMHPTISNLVFLCFLCRTLDSQRYLVPDLSEKCWSFSHNHLLFASTAGIGGLLIWVVGVPLVAWRSLSHVRHRLHTKEVKEKYGFLYNGFKNEAYFWESIIMFRKIAIIFVSAILSLWGSIIQAYVLLLVLTTFTVLTLRIKPYKKRDLNQLEVISLVCSLISSYTGLYFLTSELSSSQTSSTRNYELSGSMQWLFFSIIIASNVYFLVMWIRLFLKSLSASLRMKYPRLYFVCVACCNRKRLKEDEQEHKRSQIEEEYLLILDHISNKVERIKGNLSRGANFVSRKNLRTQLTKLKHELEKVNLTHLPDELDQNGESMRAIYKGTGTQSVLDSFEFMEEGEGSIVPVVYDEIELSNFTKRMQQCSFTDEDKKMPKPRLRRNTAVLGSCEIPESEYLDFQDLGKKVEFKVTPLMKQESDPIERTTASSTSNLEIRVDRMARRKSVLPPAEESQFKEEELVERIIEPTDEHDISYEFQEAERKEIDGGNREEKQVKTQEATAAVVSPKRRKSHMRATFGVEASFQNMEDIIKDIKETKEGENKKQKFIRRQALKYFRKEEDDSD